MYKQQNFLPQTKEQINRDIKIKKQNQWTFCSLYSHHVYFYLLNFLILAESCKSPDAVMKLPPTEA